MALRLCQRLIALVTCEGSAIGGLGQDRRRALLDGMNAVVTQLGEFEGLAVEILLTPCGGIL